MQNLVIKTNDVNNKSINKKVKIFCLFIVGIFLTISGYNILNNTDHKTFKNFEKYFFSSFFSTNFKIEEIQIFGINIIKENTILKALNLKKESSLYEIDLNEIHKIIKGINFISEVTIERKFNNTLKISIIEKKPVGILQKNNNYKIITKDGTLINEKEIHNFSHLPIFNGKNVEHNVNKILSLLNEIDFLKYIWSVTLVNERRWNLNLKNGITILLPEKEFSSSLKKINNLNKNHNFLQSNLVEIDLRDKKKIIFQPLIKPLDFVQK